MSESNRIYKLEVPGEYMIVSKTKPYECFVMFDCGQPIFSTDLSKGMIFTFKEFAEHVTDKFGDEWHVIDVSQKALDDAKRLLKAIFSEDEDDAEND